MNSLVDLSNKRILVVGASSGIGKQTAITLSQIGAKLSLIARNEEKLKSVIAELEGDGHDYFVADVSDVVSIESLVKEIVAKDGLLDGLVYSAGITGSMPLNMLKPEKLQHVMNTNFFGFIECVRQFSKKGHYANNARIVSISSLAAKCGDKSHTAYSASKAAMEGAIRCIAIELAEKGIAVNAVAPGMTKTEMFNEYVKKTGEDSAPIRKIIERQYLGFGEPEDIANVICFLLSPAARFITGATIPIDGGYTTC